MKCTGNTTRSLAHQSWNALSKYLLAALLLGPLFGLAATVKPAHAASGDCTTSGQNVTCTYTYTGKAETFTVPAGVAGVRIVARGAAGAVGVRFFPTDALGGQGGEVSANLAVSPNQSLVLVVGGAPTEGDCYPGILCTGGFNGGGTSHYGGGGGGASDVRVGGSGLAQRVLVAAGGGGGGESSSCDGPLAGGNGGNAGIAGSAGAGCRTGAGGSGGQPGSQTAGGAGGAVDGGNGTLATGGNGGGDTGGGGGGGYYGGGGGGRINLVIDGDFKGLTPAGGGGGGSNLVPADGSSGFTTEPAAIIVSYTSPDSTPPVITPNVVGTLGSNDWYVSDVTLTWNVNDPESSVTSQTGCETQNITADTLGVTFTCAATSAGGSASSQPVTIKRDATKPVVASATPDRAPNAASWYNAPLTVAFDGLDATSGVASCTSSTYNGPDSATGSVSGTCTDNAGNISSPIGFGFQYDATAPVLAPTVTPNPASLNLAATASPHASDATSGVASQVCGAVNTTSVGSKSVSCTATDNADNIATANAFYSVINDAPTIAVAPGGTCSDGGASGAIKFTVGDANTGAGGLTLQLVNNSNPQLLPNKNVLLSGTSASRTMSVTAAAKKSGTAVLTIGVGDGTSTTTLVVTVIVGTDGNETINGTAGTDMIFGLLGRNTINGLGSNDLLCGGNGVDTLNGGDGGDTLVGNRGDDTLTGDAGPDYFSGGQGTDTATDFTPSQGDSKDSTVEKVNTIVAAAANGADGADLSTFTSRVYLPTLQR